MKIAIFGYYNLADGYLACYDSLTKQGHEMSFFPFMRFKNDNIPKDVTQKTIDKFVNCSFTEEDNVNTIFHYSSMKIPASKPDILFFWTPTTDISEILSYTKTIYSGKIVWHNWDPSFSNYDHPHWLGQKEQIKHNLKYFDLILSVNPLEVEYYKSIGLNCEHCYSGFDENYSFPEKDEKYICDVSAVITNLYADSIWNRSAQKVNRKDLLDKLYENKNIKLNIYGTENLKNIYPDSYCGMVPYKNCNKVFYNSKVNLCIHAVSIDYYLSERAAQIIGSSGLLVTDNKMGLNFIENEDYILADNLENTYQTILNLLIDDDKRLKIVENGYNKRLELNWNKITDKLIHFESKLKLYYLHIPRCGGSSMYNLLKNYYPELLKTNNGNIMSNNIVYNWPNLSKYEIEKLYADNNILFNEISIQNSLNLSLNIKYFTIIRNPVDRLISILQNSYVNNNNLNINFEEYLIHNLDDVTERMLIYQMFSSSSLDDFYKKTEKFTVFQLEDINLNLKIHNFFKENSKFDIETFPVSHQRETNDKLTIKVKQCNLTNVTLTKIHEYLETDLICYNYLLQKCV